MIITWNAPNDGGSVITGYTISIRTSDEVTFLPEHTNCDMSASTDLTCTIPVAVLREAPFNLLWGSHILAKVVAINAYGNSLVSEQGSGAVIISKPSAPTNLVKENDLSSDTSLILTW